MRRGLRLYCRKSLLALHHYYLLKQFENAANARNVSNQVRAYFTFGGLEDSNDDSDTSMLRQRIVSQRLVSRLGAKNSGVLYKGDIFSNLGHMDTQIPTFLKGLQWMLQEE